MAELNCSSIYSIIPYDKFKALQKAAAASSASSATAHARQRAPLRNFSTGITPTMERCSTAGFLSPFSMAASAAAAGGGGSGGRGANGKKKRSISPTDERGEQALASGAVGPTVYKRTKSVTEEATPVAATAKKPVFEEPDTWG